MSIAILICGASVRAAAFSCLRAGYSPLGADCFADRDLASTCRAIRVDEYPRGFLKIAEIKPAECWMYTGGLENHPDLVDRMAANLPLLGVAGDRLRQVRDPWRLQTVLERNGLPYPDILPHPSPDEGTWLRKPVKSCGGMNIRQEDGSSAPASKIVAQRRSITTGLHPRKRAWYWQQFVEGISLSGSYVAVEGRSLFLGACRQLIGEKWTGAHGFQFCGAIGPLILSNALHRQFVRLGNVIAAEFALQGVFGIDVVQQGDLLWALEVNPRYTASMELLEQGLSINIAALHVAACREKKLPVDIPTIRSVCCAKGVVFARKEVTINHQFSNWADETNAGKTWPHVADLPVIGNTIHCGHPVATIFGEGADSDAALTALRAKVKTAQQLLDT